jgi:signal transduction histidine kinase
VTAGPRVDRSPVPAAGPAAPPEVRPRRFPVFAVTAAVGVATCLAVVAVDVALGYPAAEMLTRYTFTNAAFGLAFVPVAGLILSRHPRHRVGWLMLWIGLAAPAQILAGKVAELLAPAGAPVSQWPLPVQVLAWIPAWLWAPAVLPLILLLPLHFPDGALPGPRWRFVRWAAYAVIALLAVGFAGGFWLWSPAAADMLVAEVIAEDQFLTPVGAIAQLTFPVIVPVVLAVFASVVVRYLRASSLERHQLRWLLFGLAIAVPIMTVAMVAQGLAGTRPWQIVAETVAVLPIPLTMGVAILRYRLYDIDVVISRSLTAAGLALFISAVYVCVVVGCGALLGLGDQPSLALQIVATAIVAVAFQPVRLRLRALTDRLVFGRRATPYEVLAQFSRTAAQTASPGALPAIATLIADGTGAQPATVWLRVVDRLRPAASASAGPDAPATPEPVPLGPGGALPELPADAVAPVLHDGRLLGALAVTKARGEQVTEQDRDLLERLAAGVALVLRNVALTEELKARLAELTASRERLVHAQDEARRRLERDLRDDAQGRLDTLEAGLGSVRELAAQIGAARTGSILDQVGDDVDAAAETLRELAGGIYPPLLEAEGLGPALEAQAHRAALPVTVHAAGVGRHDRDVEACVYFCALEALQNTAKYAEATSASSTTMRAADLNGCWSSTMRTCTASVFTAPIWLFWPGRAPKAMAQLPQPPVMLALPSAAARYSSTARTRLCTSGSAVSSSLAKIELMCFSTARSDSTSALAMAALFLPVAICASTSVSRAVSRSSTEGRTLRADTSASTTAGSITEPPWATARMARRSSSTSPTRSFSRYARPPDPAANNPTAKDGSTYWLSTTTPMPGWVERNCSAARMPSLVPVGGIRMSVSTTSGSSSATVSNSSGRLSQVATRSTSSTVSSSRRTPSRTR